MKNLKIKSQEQGRGRWSTESFTTLAEASKYIQDRWQGAEYMDGPDGFHTDYCRYQLVGFSLRDIGVIGWEDGCRTFAFRNLETNPDGKARIVGMIDTGGDIHHTRATEAFIAHCQSTVQMGWVEDHWTNMNAISGPWTDAQYVAKFGCRVEDDGFLAQTIDEQHAAHTNPDAHVWCPLCQEIIAARPQEQPPF